MENVDLRFVRANGNVYLRNEDVARLLREIGATEETDVRNRLEQAAQSVEKVGKEKA